MIPTTKNITLSEWQTAKDEDILAASMKKPSLFGILVDRYQNKFYKSALNVVRQSEEAEDIVQESFTKMYFKANTFRPMPNGSFKSWAYKIVFNTAFVHYRKLKKQQKSSLDMEPANYELLPDPAANNFGKDAELKDLVESTMIQMPKHLQAVLSKYYLEGESYKEIAEKEETTISTIKMRIFRARRIFRKLFDLKNNNENLKHQEVKIY